MSQQQLQYVYSILLKPLIIICTFHRSNKKAFDSVDPLSRFILFEKLCQNYWIKSPSMVLWLPFWTQTVVSKGPRCSTRIFSWTAFITSATQNCNFNAKDTILYVSSSFLDLAIANLEFAYDTLQNSQNAHKFNLNSDKTKCKVTYPAYSPYPNPSWS